MSMRIRAAKDLPDEDADDDDKDDSVDVVDDDENDSNYEEGLSSRRRKQKSKVKSLRTKAKPRRRRGLTRAEDERADGAEDERIDKITDLLVEGKKGVELERALEQWQTEKRARAHVHNAPGEKSKSPTLIITINPTSASITVTAHSPVSSMLSPMTPTLTPTPPQSPRITQTQGLKRSLSAPAPDMRLGPSMQALGSYPQAQLGYGPAPASTMKWNWSTASVSVWGDGEREVQRRETISLPLPLEGIWNTDAGTDAGAQTGILSRPPQTQVFESREADLYASIGGEAYVAPFRIANLEPVENSSITNTAEDETSTSADALQYYYPTPPASGFQVGAWDSQVQVRERGQAPPNMNLNPHASWWPSNLPKSPNEEDASRASEPVREGSFDQMYEYGYGYGMNVGGGYTVMYGEMGRTHRFNCTLGDVEFEQDQRLCRERQEWTMNPTPSISATVYSPSPIPDSPSGSVLVPNTGTRSRTPTSPDANALTNTNTDKDTSADGHTFFCPAAPSPIELVMVPRSSFSSLRGWDGVDCEEGSAGEMGLGQRHGHAQEAWFGLGRMQSVGLGLGGEEEGEVGGCEW
ncbi:hypothetical protein H2248_004006 [Termitomyces sp. 'cryptogamus']|nr:hypothetical protein H2248_004006 [Termitomyces sp. 'cryptogamus']